MSRVHSLRFILIALGLLVIIEQLAIASAASQVYLTPQQAVSPYGGGQIAFTSAYGGSLTTHVFLINPDDTDLRQVSFDPDCKVAYMCSDMNPAWSTDGKYIAFLSGQDKQSRTTIEVVNLSNGKQITLATHVFSSGPPAWAPTLNQPGPLMSILLMRHCQPCRQPRNYQEMEVEIRVNQRTFGQSNQKVLLNLKIGSE